MPVKILQKSITLLYKFVIILIDDLTEDEMEESVSRSERVKKSDVEKVIDALTISEALLRKDKRYGTITTAIKDIKSELIMRGRWLFWFF